MGAAVGVSRWTTAVATVRLGPVHIITAESQHSCRHGDNLFGVLVCLAITRTDI